MHLLLDVGRLGEIEKSMRKTNIKNLETSYKSVCSKYISSFCEKQEMEFYGWVGDIVGGVALCSDFFFNFQDIVWDVNSEQLKGLIIDWYYECLEIPEKSINYYSYTKGLRASKVN